MMPPEFSVLCYFTFLKMAVQRAKMILGLTLVLETP